MLSWSAMHITGRMQSTRCPYPGSMWPSAGPSKGTKEILFVIADELSVKSVMRIFRRKSRAYTPLGDDTSLSSSASIDSAEKLGTCFGGIYADMRRDARPSQLSPSRSSCASDMRGSRNGTLVLCGAQSVIQRTYTAHLQNIGIWRAPQSQGRE